MAAMTNVNPRWERPRAGTTSRSAIRPWMLITAVILFALVVALAVAVDMHKGPLPGDVAGSRAVQDTFWGRGGLTTALDDVSAVSWPLPGAITVAVITGLLLLLRQWLSALIAPLALGAADGSNYLISQIVRRPRPSGHGIHVLQNIKNYYSFPSGHVLYAIVFAGFLIFLALRARNRLPWLNAVIVILAAFIALMPISRLLEGEHWPSDVVEGALWGAFWLLVAVAVYRWAWVRWPALRRHCPAPGDAAPPRSSGSSRSTSGPMRSRRAGLL